MQRCVTKSFYRSVFSYTSEQIAQDPTTVFNMLNPTTPARFFHSRPTPHDAPNPTSQNKYFELDPLKKMGDDSKVFFKKPESSHDATGFFVFMATMAGFLSFIYYVSVYGPNTSSPEEGTVSGEEIEDHPLVYDADHFIFRGEKLEGHLTGQILTGMFDGKSTSFVSKNGPSKTRMAVEIMVASIFEKIYAQFDIQYPRSILIQTPAKETSSATQVTFMTASEILPNTLSNLEQFLKLPDVFDRLDKKPLKGLGLAIALNRIYGDVDIKLPNFIVRETNDCYLVLPIDHECALNYSPCFVTSDEPIEKTLKFVAEFAHASSQSRMSLTNDPELMGLLSKSIEEDRKNFMPKLYEVVASLDVKHILKIADPLQVFASVPQFQKIQSRVQESLSHRDPNTGLPVQFMARPINRASRFLNMINSGHLGRGIESREDRLY